MSADTYGKTNAQPGFRLLDGSFINDLISRVLQGGLSRQDGITARAGGTKAAATVLKRSLNRISVCATAADSVLLPKAIAGSVVVVTNSGAAAAQVFGKGTDTINGVATATGVSQGAGLTAAYVCYTTGAWFRLLSA